MADNPPRAEIAHRPSAPPTALERLLGDVGTLKQIPVETVTELHRIHRIEVEDARRVEFHAAKARVQSRMSPVRKAATGDRGSKYAKAEAVCKMLDPLLIAEGFSWAFSDLDSPHAGCKRVVMTLQRAGHEEQHYYDAPLWDGRGAKGGAVMTPLQASGAIESYAQRRLRSGVFGVTLVDDLDGADPAAGDTITEDQAADLQATLDELKVDRARFRATYGVERLEDLTQANLRGAHHALAQRRRMNR